MAEIIPFPDLLTRYPDAATDLPKAECVLLVALRVWMDGQRQNIDPLPALRHGLLVAGAPEAAALLDAMLSIMACTARSPAAIRRPAYPCLSNEEKLLLRAASLAQTGQERLAERVLRMASLSAHEARLALDHLLGVGELFNDANLHFQRQDVPVPPASANPARIWSADLQARAVHYPQFGENAPTGRDPSCYPRVQRAVPNRFACADRALIRE